LWFEPNAGQVKGRTEFVGRTRGAYLYMTGSEVVFAMAPAKIAFGAKMRQVRMRFEGASAKPAGVGEEPTGGYSNYFVGKTEKDWHTGIPHFEKLHYRDVYRGIDVVYYGSDGQMEYDFVVKPGADVSKLGMRFLGADEMLLDARGDLVIRAQGAEMRQRRPKVLQGGVDVPSWYETEDGVVRVRMAGFDPAAGLTIDPILDFSTYLGGPGADSINKMEMTADGNLLLAGHTQSPASPVLDPFQQPSVVSLAPIILKMSADGRRILFYSILGRNGWDAAWALGIAKDGTLVIGGKTRSAAFPTKNAFQTEFKAIWDNAFVTRMTADGRTLIYSSYLGGSNTESLDGLAIDDAGNAYFAGYTLSNDFPVFKPLQARPASSSDAFLTRISPEGKIVFSTYFGGSGLDGFWAVKWRQDGVIILTGLTTSNDFPLKDPIQTTASPRTGYSSIFLTMIADDGSAVRYSTYFGGTSSTTGTALALDQLGKIYVAGYGDDRGYPLKNPLFAEAEGFHGTLTIFDPTGKQRLYSTLLPGAWTQSLALDADGSIFIGGSATSSDFPLKDSFQSFRGGGVSGTDAFLMKISPDGSTLLFSTLMGGSNGEFQPGLIVAPHKVIYAAGQAISTDFPVNNAYQSQSGGGNVGFLYRITDNSVLPAGLQPFTVSPGRLTFRFVQGDAPPAAAPIAIGSLTGQVFAAPSVPWLRVTPAGLGVSGTMTVSADPSGLPPGVYQGSIKLTPSTGDATSVDVTLTVLAQAPILSAVSPALVPVGTDDTEITLRGSGFTNKTTVQIATVPWVLSPVRFVDSTTLRFTLPKPYFSAETNHSITVQNPDSVLSKPVSLAVGRPAPAIAAKGIVSAASFAGDVISPGEIITIFGENFEQGMRVNFDGILATPLYITPKQLSVTVPYALAGAKESNVIVEVDFDRRSVPVRIAVWPARPAVFTANSSGQGQGAVLNQDGSVNSAANPATKGSVIVFYATGGGELSGDRPALPVKVFIDGIDSEVLYAGIAPGLVSGALQINVRLPDRASKGGVVLRVGERESQEGVFVALKE